MRINNIFGLLWWLEIKLKMHGHGLLNQSAATTPGIALHLNENNFLLFIEQPGLAKSAKILPYQKMANSLFMRCYISMACPFRSSLESQSSLGIYEGELVNCLQKLSKS